MKIEYELHADPSLQYFYYIIYHFKTYTTAGCALQLVNPYILMTIRICRIW
jgi:hypothetical protein